MNPSYLVSVYGIRCFMYPLDENLVPLSSWMHPFLVAIIFLHDIFNQEIKVDIIEDYRETPAIVLERMKGCIEGADPETMVQIFRENGISLFPTERSPD